MRQQDEILLALRNQPPPGRQLLYRQAETLAIAPDSENVLAALEAGLTDSDPLVRAQALAGRGTFLPRLLRAHSGELTAQMGVDASSGPFAACAAAALEGVVQGLERALSSNDSRRLRALVALGLYPTQSVLGKLEAEARKPEVGLLVAESLARFGGADAARILAAAIVQVPTAFRPAQIGQLRFLPSAEGSQLVDVAIRSGDAVMLRAAALALEGLDVETSGRFAAEVAARCTDGWATLQMLESVRRLGSKDHAPLVRGLIESSRAPLVRATALRVFGTLRSPDAVPTLLKLLPSLPERLRPYALESLALAQAPEEEIRPVLESLLGSSQLLLVLPAIETLLAYDTEEAFEMVGQLLGRSEPMARFVGVRCLAFIQTEESRDRLGALIRMDPSVAVRTQVALSLGELARIPGAAELVIESLGDEAPEVRRAGAQVIAQFGLSDDLRARVLEALEKGLKREPDSGRRGAWARAFACHQDPEGLADRIRGHVVNDPVFASFLIRAADPGQPVLTRLLAQLARRSDVSSVRPEVDFGLISIGELSGAADLGRMIAESGEREALEACAVAERLGMLLPVAHQVPRMAGLVKRIEGGDAQEKTTARLRRLAATDRDLESLLRNKARDRQRQPARRGRKQLSISANRASEEGVEGLSLYSVKAADVPAANVPTSPRLALPGGLSPRAGAVALGVFVVAFVLGRCILQPPPPPPSPRPEPTAHSPGERPHAGSELLVVTETRGSVKDAAGRPLTTGMALDPVGTLYATGSRSHLTLRLGNDDSTFALGSNCRVQLALSTDPADGGPPVLEIRGLEGTAVLDVQKARVRPRVFLGRIRADVEEALARVCPTEIRVGRGQVVLYQGDRKSLVLERGRQVDIDMMGEPATPAAFVPSAGDWTLE